MTKETKHLIHWWLEWAKRLVLTTYHLINRKAYRKWKARRVYRYASWPPDLEALDI